MKILCAVMLGLFLFSCSDSDYGTCVNQGRLCNEYQEDYFRCKHYEYYNDDVYGYAHTAYVHVWYKIKDLDGEWTYWDDYSEMRGRYCHSSLIDEEENL